jgi:hypothetical protein
MNKTITICSGIGLDMFTPEYVTVEIPTKDVKSKIKNLTKKTIKKYEGGELTKEALNKIGVELEDALNGFLSDHDVYPSDFPIEFENELGSWRIESDGNTTVVPKLSASEISVTIEFVQ